MTDEVKKNASEAMAELATRYGLTPEAVADIVVRVAAAQRTEEEQRQLDMEQSDLVHVLVAIEKLDPKRQGITARGIVKRLFPPREQIHLQDEFEDARDAIVSITRCVSGRTPDAIRFAKCLAKHRGRVMLGHKIERVATGSDDSAIRWTVTHVSPS